MSTLTSRFTRVFGAELTAKVAARLKVKQESLLEACDAAICSYFNGSNYVALADRFNLPAWSIRGAVQRHQSRSAA